MLKALLSVGSHARDHVSLLGSAEPTMVEETSTNYTHSRRATCVAPSYRERKDNWVSAGTGGEGRLFQSMRPTGERPQSTV